MFNQGSDDVKPLTRSVIKRNENLPRYVDAIFASAGQDGGGGEVHI
jgi:hypothetical protein